MSGAVLTGAAAAAAVALLGFAASWRLWMRPSPSADAPSRLARHADRQNQGAEVLIESLDGLARRVRAGETLDHALSVAPLRANGADPDDVHVAEHALALAREVGGPVAATIDAAASTLRARQAVRDEIAAHSSQARLSARVLTLLPLAVAAWTATSAGGRAAYASPTGLVCVVVGGLLSVTGWWWMRRLISKVAR